MPDCPRCKLELQSDDYEGVETLFCSTCWGHWMTRDAFTQVLENERYTFSDAEKKSALRSWSDGAPDDPGLEPIVYCPICGGETERKDFADNCPVVLDLCHEHGVWLDASEIKQVQVFFDSLKKS